jgi:lipoyl(octanoyl) transferase
MGNADLPTQAPQLASIVVRSLGQVAYRETLEAMRRFTNERNADTPDELWLLEHRPVYTNGQAGRPEHWPRQTAIPIEQVDRGGQITYHGPGQVVIYVLVDLPRRGLNVRGLVTRMETAVIALLADYGVAANRRADAPGVYVEAAKIAALGLRVRHGRSYHGLALNVDMDLAPFAAIDPCGYPGLAVTQLRDLNIALTPLQAAEALAAKLVAQIEP